MGETDTDMDETGAEDVGSVAAGVHPRRHDRCDAALARGHVLRRRAVVVPSAVHALPRRAAVGSGVRHVVVRGLVRRVVLGRVVGGCRTVQAVPRRLLPAGRSATPASRPATSRPLVPRVPLGRTRTPEGEQRHGGLPLRLWSAGTGVGRRRLSNVAMAHILGVDLSGIGAVVLVALVESSDLGSGGGACHPAGSASQNGRRSA